MESPPGDVGARLSPACLGAATPLDAVDLQPSLGPGVRVQHLPNGGGDLADWHRRVPGSLVLDTENRCLIPLIANKFGYHLLIVGSRDYLPVLGAARVQHCIWLEGPSAPARGPEPEVVLPAARCSAVRGDPGAMPITSDSIDILILPHIIEFQKNPHAVLREAERVLVPEGHLVVAGYNPLGLMGAWNLMHRRGAPWNGHFYTARRVRDWLSVLGFDTTASEGCFFRPPLPSRRLLRQLRGFESAGPRFWPGLCGTWLLVARKRTATLTPLRPGWRRRGRRIRGAGLAGPATMKERGRYSAEDAA